MKLTEAEKKQRQEQSAQRQKDNAALREKIKNTFPQFTEDELKIMFPDVFQ